MFFDIFVFSNFFFMIGVMLVLTSDLYFQTSTCLVWVFGLGMLALPLFLLVIKVSVMPTLNSCSLNDLNDAFAPLTYFIMDNVVIATTLWQKSMFLACMLPLVMFFSYLLTKPTNVKLAAVGSVLFILFSGTLFVLSSQLMLMFLCFELLLLSSLYLLRLTAKSERIGEAVTEMFFWTLAGSMFLFIGFFFYFMEGVYTLDEISLAMSTSNLASFMFLFGFGVKLPLWPCFSWLLKAHVEASVEFSILLSGVIVKFGALGIFSFMNQAGMLVNTQLLAMCSLMGIMEASLSLLAQSDMKRMVALTTVMELNWVGFCIAKGGLQFEQMGAYLLVAHSFTTASEFFLVECLYKRFHTSDFFFISGIAASTPTLWIVSLLTALVTIGFPGTSLFTAKLLFFGVLASFSMTLFLFFIFFFLLFIPMFFMSLWVPVWFGTQAMSLKFDLSAKELTLFVYSLGGSLLVGLFPGLIVDFV